MKAGRGWAGLVILAASVALAGCVNLPTGGPANDSNGVHGLNPAPNNNLSQDGIVVNPVQPGPQWDPQEIVSGFLAASGARLSVARQFLTPGYAAIWRPRPAAQVIDTNAPVAGSPISSKVTGGPQTTQVTVSSDDLETLIPTTPTGASDAFTLQTASGAGPYVFRFGLVEVAGRWRISRISGPGVAGKSVLLISNADFLRDYQPRNLYYPVNASATSLVPYPVYIPDRLGTNGLMKLVEALIAEPPSSSWLYHAVPTGFPAGTKVTSVQIHGSEAVISLGGAIGNADFRALQQLQAQLVITLAYSPYSPDTAATGIMEVQLVTKNSSSRLLPTSFQSWLPQATTGDVYYQSAGTSGPPRFYSIKSSAVGLSRRSAEAGRSPVVLPAGLGFGPLDAMAISPGAGFPSTFAGCRGKEVYVVPLFGKAPLVQPLASQCTALSWDDRGRLWVAEGSDVFRLTESATSSTGLDVTLVTIPTAQVVSADTITALRFAPDGIRVAMIVQGKSGSMVYVTSTTIGGPKPHLIYLGQNGQLQPVGPDLDNPVGLTWWGPDHLLVLDQRHGDDQLYEVPLNGGQSTRVPTPPGVVTVTGNGSVVVVGTKTVEDGSTQELIESATGLNGIWHQAASGSLPTYPG
jgi:hypothetical protein